MRQRLRHEDHVHRHRRRRWRCRRCRSRRRRRRCNAAEFREAWRGSIPIDELFDVVVDSSEEGVRKPDPRIFERTLERLGVEAPRSIFLDDYPGNDDRTWYDGVASSDVTVISP